MRRLPAVALPLLLAASSAALGACGKDPAHFQNVFDPCEPLVLVPAADVSAAERQSIADALALWDAVAATRLTLTEDPAARHLAVRFENAWWFGKYDDTVPEISMGRDSLKGNARVTSIVLAHELGHAMGLFHVDAGERASVMNAGNVTVAPTPADAADLVALWGSCVAKP